MSADESNDQNTDWAAEYLGEGQDILDGAGHHTGSLARADVFFQASAAVSLYEIQAALKVMLPMLEHMATPPRQIELIHDTPGEQTAEEQQEKIRKLTELKNALERDLSAHRSTSSEE